MKRRKNILLMLALLIVLLLIYFGLNSWNRNAEEKEAKEAEKATIYLVSDDELTAISYTDGTSSVGFVMEEGSWYYEVDKEIPINQETIDGIEDVIVNLTAERKLEEPDALEDYGLTESSYTVTYTADDVENTIYVGNLTGDNYYMTVNDTGSVYVCTSGLVDSLRYELSDLIQNDEVPSIGSGNLLKVEVIEDGKKTIFEEEDDLAQLAGGFGVLTLDQCAEYHVTDDVLPEYGLDKESRITATATYSDPDTKEELEFTVYIGDMADEENQYVMVEESIFVYQVSKDVVENMIVVEEAEE